MRVEFFDDRIELRGVDGTEGLGVELTVLGIEPAAETLQISARHTHSSESAGSLFVYGVGDGVPPSCSTRFDGKIRIAAAEVADTITLVVSDSTGRRQSPRRLGITGIRINPES